MQSTIKYGVVVFLCINLALLVNKMHRRDTAASAFRIGLGVESADQTSTIGTDSSPPDRVPFKCNASFKAGAAPVTRPIADDLTEQLEKLAEHNSIVVTTADSGYTEMVLNFVCHMRKLKIENFLVMCLDEKLHTLLKNKSIPSYFNRSMSKKSKDKVSSWNSPSFNEVVHIKTKQQHAVLARGFDIIFSDVDIVWKHDVRCIVLDARHETEKIMGRKPPVDDGVPWRPADLLIHQNWPTNEINPGFFFARASNRTTRYLENVMLYEKYMASLPFDPKDLSASFARDDQACMNHVLGCGNPDGSCQEELPDFLKNRKYGSACGFDNFKMHTIRGQDMLDDRTFRTITAKCDNLGFHLKYGLVSPYWFQTGNTQYKEEWRRGAKVLHANYMSGSQRKKDFFRTNKAWCNVSNV